MVTLLLTGSVGATDGAIVSAYQSCNQRIIVFSTRRLTFVGEAPVRLPTWLSLGPRGQTHFQVGRYLQHIIDQLGISHVISLGAHASTFAARHLGRTPYTAVMMRGDVTSAGRRRASLVGNTASELVIENSVGMDQAAAFGSRVPHLRLPLLRWPSVPVLASAGTRVAIIHDDDSDPGGTLQSGLLSICRHHGVRVRPVRIGSLYGAQQLAAGETLDVALRRRLAGFTHVVVLGDHRDTAAILTTIARQPGRVLVEATLASSELAGRLDVQMARGAALVERLGVMLTAWRSDRRSPGVVGRRAIERVGLRSGRLGGVGRRAIRALDRARVHRLRARERLRPPAASLAVWMSGLARRDLPWYFEELWSEQPPGSFDVYFTVAPIEDRANGARPQRVRNVAEALRDHGPTVVLRPNHFLMDRRGRLVEYLVRQGWRPRMVYGENSTSPMSSYDLIDRAAAAFRWLGAHGALRAWFVRDLHWLSKEEVAGYSPSAELIALGLYELSAMQSVTELLLAPNDASRREFFELLGSHTAIEARWGSLPPALHPDNVCRIEQLAPAVDGLTLLYAGGMNDFYRQDVFLSAVSKLSDQRGFHLDLVVREAEAELLEESLARSGVAPKDTIRVLTDDLSKYLPLTRSVLGVVLLDGHYAIHSFPYKTVSMLERGLHVLCYEDMAVSTFLSKYDAGVFCAREASSVLDVARAYRDRHDRIDMEPLLKRESWSARVDQVWAMLQEVGQQAPIAH